MSNSKFFLALIVSIISLNGCAVVMKSDYQPHAAEPTADVRLIADSDSTGMMGRHYSVLLSRDNMCMRGRMVELGGKLIAEAHEELPAVAIPAKGPISIVVIYREGRFGQQRSCGNVVSFAPLPGHSYNLNFKVTGQSMHCEILASDNQRGALNNLPSDNCIAQRGQAGNAVPNGTALITQYKIQLIRE